MRSSGSRATGRSSRSSTRSPPVADACSGSGRSERSRPLKQFFRWFGDDPHEGAAVRLQRHVGARTSRSWRSRPGHALHILDRFHITQQMNKAIEKVRRAEVRELKQRRTARAADQRALGAAPPPAEPNGQGPRPAARSRAA